ncbi:MAG: hypothetical protein AAF483_14725 [Planctomycetota bacterium]
MARVVGLLVLLGLLLVALFVDAQGPTRRAPRIVQKRSLRVVPNVRDVSASRATKPNAVESSSTAVLTQSYANGDIRAQVSIRRRGDGVRVRHGSARFWYPNGGIRLIGEYDSGRRVGEWTRFYRNGRRKESGTYDAGLRVGEWLKWSLDGSQMNRTQYRAGFVVELLPHKGQAPARGTRGALAADR